VLLAGFPAGVDTGGATGVTVCGAVENVRAGVDLGLRRLEDPLVRTDAIEAIGLMRYVPARELVAGLCADPDENVRAQAKKALKRIDQAPKPKPPQVRLDKIVRHP